MKNKDQKKYKVVVDVYEKLLLLNKWSNLDSDECIYLRDYKEVEFSSIDTTFNQFSMVKKIIKNTEEEIYNLNPFKTFFGFYNGIYKAIQRARWAKEELDIIENIIMGMFGKEVIQQNLLDKESFYKNVLKERVGKVVKKKDKLIKTLRKIFSDKKIKLH